MIIEVMINKLKKISICFFVFLCTFFASCYLGASAPTREEQADLNSVYDDTFTFISTENTDRDTRYSYYLSKKLNKTVTVIEEVTKRTPFSVTTSTFSNYLSLKFYDEIIENYDLYLAKLSLKSDDYRIFPDSKLYTSIYVDIDNFESLYYFCLNNPDLVSNKETIYLAINKSSLQIPADKYVNAVCYVFSDSGIYSNIKIFFVNDSVNLESLKNYSDIEKLSSAKDYEDCYMLNYDFTNGYYRGKKL